MGWIIGSIVVFVIALAGINIGRAAYKAYIKSEGYKDTYLKGYNFRTVLYSLLSLFAFVIILFGCFTKVSANEVGIIYHDQKGVLEEVKYEGFQVKSPFEHITTISTTNKTAQLTVAGQTSDSAYADFIITVVYKIEAVNAGLFYKATSATDIASEQLSSMAKEALQSSTIKYDIYSILGDKLEVVRLDFTENLKSIMYERYHITVVSTSFDDIDAGTRIEEIIKNKAEALQQIEIAEAEKQKALVEKEKALIEAETRAEAARIAAEAEAEVKKIAADAEAYKVETEKSAVTDMIDALYEKYNASLSYTECANIVLQTLFYETWNGEFPEVVTSDSLSSLIGSLISSQGK